MNRVELAICRFRQKLPGNEGFVTLGSGCIAKCQHLAAKFGWKNPNIIFTSNCVLTKEALASGRCFVVDFIASEKKGLDTFDLRLAADTCVEIDSRDLGFVSTSNTNGGLFSNGKHSVSDISITAISAEHLDKRNFLKRMVKRSILQSSRPIECHSASNHENLLRDGLLYCVVILELSPNKQQPAPDFQTRTYKFSYSKDREQFMLEEFGAGNCLLHAKDFSHEEKPYGAVICSKTGEFAGVLDFIDDRMLPLFLPTGSSGEQSIVNNQETTVSKTKEIHEGDQTQSFETSQQSESGISKTYTIEENETQGEGNIVNYNLETIAFKAKETIEGDQKQSFEASQQSAPRNSEIRSTEECRTQVEGNIVKTNQETTASKTKETIEGDQKQSFEASQHSVLGNSEILSTEECRTQELFVGFSAMPENSLRPPTEETSVFVDHKPNSDKTLGQDSVLPLDEGRENCFEKGDTVDEDGLASEPVSDNNTNYGERAVEKVDESVECSNIIGTSEQSNVVVQPGVEENHVPESPVPEEASPFDDQRNSEIGEGRMQITDLETRQSIDTEYAEPSSQSLNEDFPPASIMQSASAACQETTENIVKDEKEESEEAFIKTEKQTKPKEIESLVNNSQKMISNLDPETSTELHLNSPADGLSTVDPHIQKAIQDLSPSDALSPCDALSPNDVVSPKDDVGPSDALTSNDAVGPNDALSPNDAVCPNDAPSSSDAVGPNDCLSPYDVLSPNDAVGPNDAVDRNDALSPNDAFSPNYVLSPNDADGPNDADEPNDARSPNDAPQVNTESNEGNVDMKGSSSFDGYQAHVPGIKVNDKRNMTIDVAVETKKSHESVEDTEESSVIKQSETLVTVTKTTKEKAEQYASTDVTKQENKHEDVINSPTEISQSDKSSAVQENSSSASQHTEAHGDVLDHDTPITENVKSLMMSETSSGSEGHILSGEQTSFDAKGPLGNNQTSDAVNRKHSEYSNSLSEDYQTFNKDGELTSYGKDSLEDVKIPDSEGKVNILLDNVDRELIKPAKGPSEDNPTQDIVARQNTEQTKILETPHIVVDVVDGAEQESGQTEAETGKASSQETPSFSLGTDLGQCVRSLSDMNIVVKRLTTETLLSEAVTRDPVVLEMLGRYLDIEYRYGQVSCWRDVADLLAVPSSLFESCLAYCKSSPTEDLFGFLAAAKPETTMHDVKEILKRMERVDVVQSIDKHLARCGLNSGIVVGSLMEKEEEYIVGRIAVKLDKPHPQNWRSLAAGLGIPRKVFRNFGALHEYNAALQLLKYLPIFDPELSVAMLKDTLDEIDRSDVVDILDAAGIPDNDPLKDILDDVELMDQVSDLLNEEGLVDGKNWRHLAKEIGVPRDKRKEFEPTEDRPSPTTLLFGIIETFDPDITVEELILALVAMKRHDVLEAMKKHFESEDIHKILEDNNLLPPMDDSTCSRLEAEVERDWDVAERSDSEPEGNEVED